MKKVGFATAAMLAVITVACGGGRDESTTENRDATVGTGGEVTNNPATTTDTRTTGGAGDVQDWVHEVAMHNTAEIELGKLASERASNAQVKQYGQMMVKDHTAAGNELKQAVGNQVPMQDQMDEKHRDLAQKLRGLQGMEFDREYMNAMVEGHGEVKDLLEQRARQAGNTGANTGTAQRNTGATNNPNATSGNTGAAGNTPSSVNPGNTAQVEMAVNQWAAKTLPKVEQHLQQAEQLKEKVDNSGRNTTENNTNRTGGTTRQPGQ
jgi:putative membrane protein